MNNIVDLMLQDSSYYNQVLGMSAVIAFKHRNGITVLADGQVLYVAEDDQKRIEEIKTRSHKVFRLTDNSIIGFTGDEIYFDKVQSYAEEIAILIKKVELPLSLAKIANISFKYLLSKKMEDKHMMGALIAGYGYNQKGKSVDPGFYTLYLDKTQPAINEDTSEFSAARKIHRDYYKEQETALWDNEILPVTSRGMATKYLIEYVNIFSKEDSSIGGQLRTWDITKKEITEREVPHSDRGYIAPRLKEGDKI